MATASKVGKANLDLAMNPLVSIENAETTLRNCCDMTEFMGKAIESMAGGDGISDTDGFALSMLGKVILSALEFEGERYPKTNTQS